VAIQSQQDVIQLQITIYNILFVKVFKRKQDLASVKPIREAVHVVLEPRL
jgi:hypothetical protein